jgi:hypothetical protein
MQARLPALGPVAGAYDIGRADGVQIAMNGSAEGELGGGYAAPVRRLMNIGEARSYRLSEWPDYCARFGLQHEHVGDLIRMACDAGLNQTDPTSSAVWAPMYAWRALLSTDGLPGCTRPVSSNTRGRRPDPQRLAATTRAPAAAARNTKSAAYGSRGPKSHPQPCGV